MVYWFLLTKNMSLLILEMHNPFFQLGKRLAGAPGSCPIRTDIRWIIRLDELSSTVRRSGR